MFELRVRHCKIAKFCQGTVERSDFGEAEPLLLAVLESLKVREVVRLGRRLSTEEAARSMSDEIRRLADPGTVVKNLMKAAMENDLTLQFGNGIRTFGINFKVELDGDLCGCTIYHQPGVLPVIEVGTLYFTKAQSEEDWAQKLLCNKAVDVVRTRTDLLMLSKYYGRGDHRYLFRKRSRLCQGRPAPSEDAVKASLILRELCHTVWHQHERDLVKVEETKLWPFARMRFVTELTGLRFLKAFDKALIEHVGVEKLTQLLEAMGSNLETFLEK